MRRFHLYISAAVMTAACGPAHRLPPVPEPSAPEVSGFSAAMDSLRSLLRAPGLSVAVVQDGEVLLATGLGMSDAERQIPATAETLYPIGSITKTFTSTLMLQLAEQGRLNLDDAVGRHVSWQVAPDIRIRHVLSHTSEGVPGSRFRYSSRFNWLDNVVEAATDESFRGLLEDGVLRAAGLMQTRAAEDIPGWAESVAGMAKPYTVGEDGRPRRSEYPPMGLHSSSGLVSSALDLARYGAALDAGRLLGEEALARAFRPTVSTRGDTLPYGLGWYTQNIAGQRVVWHPSWWPNAFSGLLIKVPERKLTLAVLANTDALTAPQLGAADLLLYPVANAFVRHVVLDGGEEPRQVLAADLVGRALVARWRGEPERSDSLLQRAVECCPGTVAAVRDDDLLLAFGESAIPEVREVGLEAGRRILRAFPGDAMTLFNMGVAAGQVRRAFRIQGPGAEEAVQLFEQVLALEAPIPDWMEGWSSYLVAEQVAEHDSERALQLAQRARDSGADTDGLQGRVTRLLARLQSRAEAEARPSSLARAEAGAGWAMIEP